MRKILSIFLIHPILISVLPTVTACKTNSNSPPSTKPIVPITPPTPLVATKFDLSKNLQLFFASPTTTETIAGNLVVNGPSLFIAIEFEIMLEYNAFFFNHPLSINQFAHNINQLSTTKTWVIEIFNGSKRIKTTEDYATKPQKIGKQIVNNDNSLDIKITTTNKNVKATKNISTKNTKVSAVVHGYFIGFFYNNLDLNLNHDVTADTTKTAAANNLLVDNVYNFHSPSKYQLRFNLNPNTTLMNLFSELNYKNHKNHKNNVLKLCNAIIDRLNLAFKSRCHKIFSWGFLKPLLKLTASTIDEYLLKTTVFHFFTVDTNGRVVKLTNPRQTIGNNKKVFIQVITYHWVYLRKDSFFNPTHGFFYGYLQSTN